MRAIDNQPEIVTGVVTHKNYFGKKTDLSKQNYSHNSSLVQNRED